MFNVVPYQIMDNDQFIAIEIIVIGKAPNVSGVKTDNATDMPSAPNCSPPCGNS